MRRESAADSLSAELERVVKSYGNMLYRICVVSLRRVSDAEDALQDVFVRYMDKAPTFSDCEHEKAWLIRVTVNICKNKHRYNRMHDCGDIAECFALSCAPRELGIIEAVSGLPTKHKLPMLLHYIEGYSCEEAASILAISNDTLRKRLQTARERIRLEYDWSDFYETE